ncbi:hypothetical protein [Streptomyces olivaceiscleroticus]|uniref:Uncharacterized protein n=1 Tax=Streptomyces olivaceiscleroticus TaxID=68245 RepID=A0ABN1A2M9_9ACTN
MSASPLSQTFMALHGLFHDPLRPSTTLHGSPRLAPEERAERVRQEWAGAMASTLDISRWAHRSEKSGSPTDRYVRIVLEPMEPNRPDADEPESEARGGLTPRQLHAALLEEHKRSPDLWLTFGVRTERVLTAWLGSPDRAWRKITGHGLDEYQPLPHRPGPGQFTGRPSTRIHHTLMVVP